MSTLVTWKNLQISYGAQKVVPAFEGSIRRGEKWAVLGCNGSGKSSWMKRLLGLLPVTTKKVDGEINWYCDRQKIGYVPQNLDFDSHFPLEIGEFLEISLSNRLFHWPSPWI